MKNILFLVFVLSFVQISSQQEMFFTHHVVNPYFINPAFAGANGTNVFLDYRKQWVGIVGAPEYQKLTFDTPLKQKNMGIGISISNDLSNVLNTTSGMFSYSYLANISEEQSIRFGVSLGIKQNRILFDKANVEDETEAIIFSSNQSATNLDGNFGINYTLQKFQLGATVFQLIGSPYYYENTYNQNSLKFSFIKHYMVHAKYEFDLKPKVLKLSPILVARSAQGIPFQFDGNLKFDYKDIVWLNLCYKHQVGYSFAVGTLIDNRLTIGYSYEFSSNELSNHSYGSHEVIFGLKINKKSGGGGFSSKELKRFEGQNNEMLEKTDYLQRENEEMRRKIEEQEKLLHEYIDGLEEIKAAAKQNAAAFQDFKYSNEYVVPAEEALTEVKDSKAEQGDTKYYVVVGAVRKLENAKSFQQIIKREYQLDSKVIRNSKNTWYLIYTKELNSAKGLNNELKEVTKQDKKSIFIGNPWVYSL